MAKARIVVVEDEVIVARDLARSLARLDYEVPALAATGEDALERVAAVRPDLVLMDIHLAGDMDGIDAAQAIRLRYDVPVVFLTAHSDEATFSRAQITEPYGYVLKPFEERELAIAVSVALYRHRVESRLAQMERWLSTTLRSIGDAVLATDLAGTVTFMNAHAEQLTGWSLAEARGLQLEEVLRLVREADHAPVLGLVARVLSAEPAIEPGSATLLVARDGGERPVETSAAPIRDSVSGASGFVIIVRDATARRQTEDQLRFWAVHDPLTGLANRALLMERLGHAFEHARRHPERRFGVLYLDLDDFKSINDRLGHLAGDQVLIGVARRLESSLRSEDMVARLGGDEFVILLDLIGDVRDAAHVAARIQQSMQAPMHVEGHELKIGVSIGIALLEPAYQQAEDILRDADMALYRAKTLGKGRHVLSDAAMHDGTLRLLELEAELQRAAAEHQFCLHYQPVVSLRDGCVGGREALLRWQHPERGLLPPAEFLPVLEERGLLAAVGGWVLREACRQAQAWRTEPAGSALSVTVNLSARQFSQPDLVEQVAGALAQAGLAPDGLCLDIPEEALLDVEQSLATLRRLDALGVRLQLDHFGRGATSLRLLHQAPWDALKIGLADLGPLDGAPPGAPDSGRGLARTGLLLARELGLSLVAVGVETDEQARALRQMGWEWGEGWALGKASA